MKQHLCLYLCAALGAASLAVLTGCERSNGKVADSAPLPNVQVIRPHKGEIVRSVTLPANVRAYQQATLYAKVAGYLKTIKVDRGDTVKEGDLLAEIEAPEMLADLERFKAEVAVAEAECKRVTDAQKKAPDLVMPQTVDAAKGKFEMAVAYLKRIQTLLDYAKITAPFPGIVTKRWVDPGAFIPSATGSSAAQNAAVVTLMDFTRVRIEVWMPEAEVPLVKNDLPVKVTVEDLPGHEFEGKITRFAYALDEATKTMATEMEIPNPGLALRPGMYASVKIALQSKPDAVLVPSEALVTEKKKTFVFCCIDNKAKKVAVKTGFDDGISVEILEGVTPDDRVLLAGKQGVSDGQQVHAVEVK